MSESPRHRRNSLRLHRRSMAKEGGACSKQGLSGAVPLPALPLLQWNRQCHLADQATVARTTVLPPSRSIRSSSPDLSWHCVVSRIASQGKNSPSDVRVLV